MFERTQAHQAAMDFYYEVALNESQVVINKFFQTHLY